MDLEPIIRRAQLADTTSGREGALLVGTDTKTNLGNSTTVEAALTFIDTNMLTGSSGADLFGWNDWRLPPGDPFEIRSNYGLTVTRQGDIIFVDAGDGSEGSGIPTLEGGQGITVEIAGNVNTIHVREERVALTDGATVTVDCSNDNNFILAMGASPADRDIELTNISAGQKITILLLNGGSNTVTWVDTIIWPGGTPPTLTDTADHADMIGVEKLVTGELLGFIVGQDWDLS